MNNKITGLTQHEAEEKVKEFGYNEIKETGKVSLLRILLRQVEKNFVVYLLIFAAVISILIGKTITGNVIILVIILVISVGFVQEYKAEKSISALKKMLMPISIVIRDSREKEVLSREIVPGDILILKTGERVSADCLIIKENNLRIDESILTGESKDIGKKPGSENRYSNDNMIFMGTYVVDGKCYAKVLHTGMNTKFGKIASMISTAEKKLPLQDKVNAISKYMVYIAIISSFLTGTIMLFQTSTYSSEYLVNVILLVIALSVSAFPEGFPVVLIATLAAGASRMAKQNVIINRMSIIETLGETTVICADKTGTITKGEMTVKKIYCNDALFDIEGVGYEAKGDIKSQEKLADVKSNLVLRLLIESGILCNDSYIERTGEDMMFKAVGSPTEASLLILGAKQGIFKEDFQFEREEEMPFNSERKMMSVLCKKEKSYYVYAKGAPEILLEKCTQIQIKNDTIKITEEKYNEILTENNKLTKDSYRVLALAYKKVDFPDKNYGENDFIFLGLVGIEDAPREEISESLELCKHAGIKVKMITGDNKETALSIAKQIGLTGNFVEGKEIDNMTDDELTKSVKDIVVFARVKPEHKLRIIKALKNNNEIVTMTGDGVNDAPALKEAHIGVAMGKNGTDVSRSVADMTLKDDNFVTIVAAIKEGRTIFNNIRKFTAYQLSCNFAEIFIIFVGVIFAPFLGWQIPVLLAIQILFMNIVTDNLPAITLGFNPSSKDIMKEKPRKKPQLLTRELIYLIIFNGLIMGILSLAVYYISHNVLKYSIEIARTAILVSLIFLEIVSAFNFRSFRYLVFNRGLFINRYLFYASLISIAATILIIYTPLNTLFETVTLDTFNWLLAIISSLLLIVVFDILKIVNNRTYKFFT